MPSTFQPQANSVRLVNVHAFRYQSQNENNKQTGFVLVVCLIITLIVSLGSMALIRYSNSQTQMVSMSGFQTLLRTEAGWVADQVVHQLLQAAQLTANTATNNAIRNQCNQLPNGVDSTSTCIEMSTTCTTRGAGCHQISLTDPAATSGTATNTSTNVDLYAGKTIKIHYLGELPAQGTPDDQHHLYRIDVTLKLNDWSITERRLVKLDRIGA